MSSPSAPLEATIVKADRRLGVLLGWATVSEVKDPITGAWVPHHDLQGDHLPMSVAAEAFLRFAEGDRKMLIDHEVGKGVHGKVLWMFALDADTQASLGLTGDRTGVIVGVKPSDPGVLDRFADNDLRGWSIGGRGTIEELDEDIT